MCNSSLSFAQRGLIAEELPRWLSITVNGKPITLPDPVFHEGQYQKFGKRLSIPIDVTEGVLSNLSSTAASKHLIQVAWINAPLDDCGKPLLDAVMLGQLNPESVSLLSLPLIQITLDHKRTLNSLLDEFRLPLEEDTGPASYLKRELEADSIIMQIFSSSPAHDIWGLYDFCIPATHALPKQEVLQMLKTKLKKGAGPSDLICDDDWLHLSTLCPLTRTRMVLPVRGYDCLHLECFDLSNYLIVNKKRPRWKCPICSNNCPFRHLRRDESVFTP
ncbi:hypothetical protein Ciccas_001377 [Cichlidogyrus casuarinus]|uniref:SP-RING-type domain-containing protein n=1 Tax=Cichlidogyrus casuarinus TaxID=1844966 RepID=A0ABD2QK77_9PLAT